MKNPFKSLKKKFFRKNKILPISARALNQDIFEIVFEYLGKEEHEALTEKIIKFIKDKKDDYRAFASLNVLLGGFSGFFAMVMLAGCGPFVVIIGAGSVFVLCLFFVPCICNHIENRLITWYNKVRGNGKISGKNFLKLLPLQK